MPPDVPAACYKNRTGGHVLLKSGYKRTFECHEQVARGFRLSDDVGGDARAHGGNFCVKPRSGKYGLLFLGYPAALVAVMSRHFAPSGEGIRETAWAAVPLPALECEEV
jgi:hypothetical protein